MVVTLLARCAPRLGQTVPAAVDVGECTRSGWCRFVVSYGVEEAVPRTLPGHSLIGALQQSLSQSFFRTAHVPHSMLLKHDVRQ
jgi:hypothetical protein